MFLFKKLVAPLFFPVSLCLTCLAAGLILLWFTKKQKAGKIVTTVGVGRRSRGCCSHPLSSGTHRWAPSQGPLQGRSGSWFWAEAMHRTQNCR